MFCDNPRRYGAYHVYLLILLYPLFDYSRACNCCDNQAQMGDRSAQGNQEGQERGLVLQKPRIIYVWLL